MPKKLLAVVLLASIPLYMFGQSVEDFNRVVDFDISIRELALAAAEENMEALPDKLVIIDGTVASRLLIDGNPETYVGQLELVGGEWIGVEDVVTYRCYLLLEGPRFANAIPARRSRTKNPAEIEMNTRIMVVGEFLGLFDLPNGTTVPVLNAVYIRKID
jgi:hypothetical protein